MLIDFSTGQTQDDDIMFIIHSDKNILIWTTLRYDIIPKQSSCNVEVAFKNAFKCKEISDQNGVMSISIMACH